MRTARTEPAWEPAAVRPFDRSDFYIAFALFALSWTGAALYLPTFRAAAGRWPSLAPLG